MNMYNVYTLLKLNPPLQKTFHYSVVDKYLTISFDDYATISSEYNISILYFQGNLCVNLTDHFALWEKKSFVSSCIICK